MLSNQWHKSTFSDPNGQSCVQAKFDGQMVHVGDTKNPDQQALVFTRDEWSAFIAGVRADNQFDLPA